jgi:uncharacterized protein YecE (DUF72 family)
MQWRFPDNLFVGTSSWSSMYWCGTFYSDSIEPGEMIREYSNKLPTVEIDSTWYHMPGVKTVESWKTKTPDGFVFSAKVPKVISHDKYPVDCEAELNQFVSVMANLGEKLGPLILQFPYVAKGKDAEEYRTGSEFIRRLKGFVNPLPGEFRWGIEIRNSLWVKPPLLDILRSRDISLVFIDYYAMDPPPQNAPVYVYFNNHYAGYAPGSVELFGKLFNAGDPESSG